MAFVEDLSHIDPLLHFSGLDPELVDVTHERRAASPVPLDRDLIEVNISMAHRVVTIASRLYPDNPEAQKVYISAWQEGVEAQRQATIGHFIGILVENTGDSVAEPMPGDDLAALDQPLADELPSGLREIEPFQG